MRVIVAGGGTGGHVIPALAIAQELKLRYQAEVLFIGTSRGIETRLVPAAGFNLDLITVGALNRVDFATRLKTLFDMPRAIVQSARIISDFRPDVMIGVGGYASGPAMLAGGVMNIPMLAFEPNVVPGIANRLVAPMVRAAAVHFRATLRYFSNAVVTGVPVRREFFDIPARPPNAPPTLLVFGGSQGAHAINVAISEALPSLAEKLPNLRLILQTGERDFDDLQAATARLRVSAEVAPFITDMPGAFACADLLLCRSGASTVAEVAAAGKPAIFVPLPTAADDHQRQNAKTLADAGAARLLPQSELTADTLAHEIMSLLGNRQLLTQMGSAVRRFAHPDASSQIAAMAARLAGRLLQD
jgi:UDP-N-acetylglucosamine--N-acetylmuramyl-(pentapeptide) pyrophosphoryl-undecaprenol N-acetylglucosamine transferase